MNYRSFSVQELVADTYFQQWVLNPNPMSEAFWQKWLHDHPEQRSDILEASAIIRNMQFSVDTPQSTDAQEVWQNIVRNRTQRKYKVKRKTLPLRWYGVAASVVLVVSLAALWFSVPTTRPWGVSYQTEYGQTKKIILSDSSQVTLGPNSALTFKSGFFSNYQRLAYLTGEAYFSVVHTEDERTFVVHSEEVAIEVLGTKFNVNNRRDNQHILLEEGSIRLKLAGQNVPSSEALIEMQPGEMVEISEGRVSKQITNPKKFTTWTKGIMVFDKVPLSNVLQTIEDHFGCTFVTQGINPEELILTAELRTARLELVLRYLSEVFNLNVERNHDTITLSHS